MACAAAAFALAMPSACSRAPSAASTGCVSIVERFAAEATRAGAGTCQQDGDCRCFPGGISAAHGCGGISDATTVTRLEALAAEYAAAKCRSAIQCAGWSCTPACVAGRCTNGPGASASGPGPAAVIDAGATTADASAAGGEPAIVAECVTGPIPSLPGKSPVASRTVTVDAKGAAAIRVKRADGTTDAAPLTLDAAGLARLRRAASDAARSAPHAKENGVPDGLGCRVEITDGGRTVTVEGADPGGSAALRPLMAELRALLAAGPT
jgi:hypothetical protein